VETSPSAAQTFAWSKWIFFAAASMVIGIPIVFIHPSNLNQDTYQYLSIANAYFKSEHWRIRDVHTVGPVLPALLALIKGALPRACRFNADCDVLIVKFVAFACYASIGLSAMVYSKARSSSWSAVPLAIALMFFALPHEKDVYSLNGELLCGALLAVFITVASHPTLSRLRLSILTFIALCVLYTKLQAILLLALAYWTGVEKGQRHRAFAWFGGGLVIAELIFLFAGGGWLLKAAALFTYVVHGQATSTLAPSQSASVYTRLAEHLAHLWWTLSRAWWYFPACAIAMLCAFRRSTANNGRSLFAMWLLVTVFTIYLPGREYFHYLLFVIPILFVYLPLAVREIPLEAPRHWCAGTVIAGLVVVKFCALMPSSDLFAGERIWHIFPAQTISADADAVKRSLSLSADDTLFVHGWDFRFYSYFGKAAIGPELAFVDQGSMSPDDYIRQLVASRPTYIIDVVNHSGLIRRTDLALAAVPKWSQAVQSNYEKVYDHNGLVVYRRRAVTQALPST